MRKTILTTIAGQADLVTLMEFPGHTQVSSIIGNYVFATSESMELAIGKTDKLKPIKKIDQTPAVIKSYSSEILNALSITKFI